MLCECLKHSCNISIVNAPLSRVLGKTKDYNYNVTIPATEDEKPKINLKKKREEISGKKILMSNRYGPTAPSSLKSSKSGANCD